MLAWLERMSDREKAALLVWSSALTLVLALPLSFGRAPRECFYSPEDFAGCDPWRGIAALADIAVAALISGAFLFMRIPVTTRLQRFGRFVGVLGLLLVVVGSLGAVNAGAYLIARQIAAAGFGGLGFALLVESGYGSALLRSRLGVLLGVTLVLWAIAYIPRDDQILPTGGALFFIPYVTWAIRLGYRLGTGRVPAQPQETGSSGVKVVVGSLAAIVLFFVAFPFWITSTFGVASLGDPANEVTVKNESGGAIVFYQDGRLREYSEELAAGEAKTTIWLEHGAYSPAAEDASGVRIFCRYLLNNELRRAHYLITVTRDPASCSPR